MNTSFFPTWPVDGPLPLPPVHGLLQAGESPAAGVRFVVDVDNRPVDLDALPADYVPPERGRERWLNGVEVYPYPANTPEGWDACHGSHAPASKDFGTNVTPPAFAPLTVSEAITCTSQQVPDQAAFKARAVAVLAATESFRVARELMADPLGIQDHFLADARATFPNGQVATRPNHGLQVLEQAISQTGRLGVIHCSPMLATALLGTGFVIRDTTGVIRSINGYVVIPDGGYVGVSKPEMASAPLTSTQEWAYATGPIDVRRTEIFTTPELLSQALDRGVAGATNTRPNTITYRAERYYVTVWDTALQAAVLIDRCSSICATGS